MLSYRGFWFASGLARRRLEIPCGLATLILGFGQALRISPAGSASQCRSVVSLLSPPNTRPVLGEHSGGVQGVEVMLAPWAAFELFGVALDELPDGGTELADIIGVRAERLAECLAQASHWPARFAVVDKFLWRSRTAGRTASERVVAAFQHLERSHGKLEIHALADNLGCSRRQLERGFGEQLGVTPKRLSRVLRLQHAASLLETGRRLGEVASCCGFYDQAHLTREFTAMTGRSPLRFLAERECSGHGTDRAAGRITSILQEG
ncbi:helix-turn-helix transcriptional regulator [Streptomyces sp. NPDC003032]